MEDDTTTPTILFTLEAARVNCGYTIDEAAMLFGIHRDTLWRYEQDSTRVTRPFMLKAKEVYGLPQRHIFFGIKSEFFRIKLAEHDTAHTS